MENSMNTFEKLSSALDFIEANLTEGISPEDCAASCGYSLSNMQKMFRHVFHIGISDYISRRRLTVAARELISTEENVLDIALKYGYNSHEVFTRAFMRLYGITPSQFRKSSRFAEIFPKLGRFSELTDEKGNVIMTSKKRFDVSHLYDFISERRGKYVICFDMCHLMTVNDEYGSAAGDLCIAECLRRIDSAADDSMLTIRIGGDEFVLVTDFAEEDKAEALKNIILGKNGGTVKFSGEEIPVSMRAGLEIIPPTGNIRYNKLFDSFILAGRPEG